MSLMLIQMMINGLAMGAIYALIALGFVMIYNSTGAVNFAQGDFAMIGAYLYFTAVVLLRLPVWASFIFMILGAAILGIIFNQTVFYPLRDKHWMIPLIGTIGASIFLPNFAMNIWGPECSASPRSLSAFLRSPFL
jgi:branched-chain amino acid transport system permease protein